MLLVAPVYGSVPWRLSGWAIVFGVIGVVDMDPHLSRWAGNPILDFDRSCGLDGLCRATGLQSAGRLRDSPTGLVAFLAIRFAGLVVIVPLIEEFFLRGFLMRFFVQADWWAIPLGQVTWTSAIVATVYGMLSHPAELIAAAVWFSLITLLYARTRNLWDCVVAHAVTNGLLGTYILLSHDWTLW